jgi:hypothetical protein
MGQKSPTSRFDRPTLLSKPFLTSIITAEKLESFLLTDTREHGSGGHSDTHGQPVILPIYIQHVTKADVAPNVDTTLASPSNSVVLHRQLSTTLVCGFDMGGRFYGSHWQRHATLV